MEKKNRNKLSIARETVRRLAQEKLDAAAGGFNATTRFSCTCACTDHSCHSICDSCGYSDCCLMDPGL